MTVTTQRGKTVVATTGTTWAATANAIDGAAGANPATYATWTSATANAVGTIEIGGYDFSGIAAGMLITSVSMVVRHFENVTGRFASLNAVLYDGTTVIGTARACTLATAARTDTLASSVVPTLAQIKSATFKCRLTVTHAGNTQSGIMSLDQIDIAVDWAEPRTGRPKWWNGTQWTNKPAKVWNGSAWVEEPVKGWTGSEWKVAK